ncbi:MAG: prepilin peptidase [Lachnospiraceae bacterium]|nr:prepilin peptidase [Lachnospiraceae bacterium]
MELFLTIITVVLLLLIGAEIFSVLLALARRMADDIIERQKLEEAEEKEAEAVDKIETGNPSDDDKKETENTDENISSTEKAVADDSVNVIEAALDLAADKIVAEALVDNNSENGKTEDQDETVKEAESDSDTAEDQSEAKSDTDEVRMPLPKNDFVCESCGEEIRGYDLIPFFSFIALGGRCRFCGDKIPKREFFAEFLGGIAFLLIFFRFGVAADLTTSFRLHGVLDITATMTPLRALTILVITVVTCLLFWIAAIDAFSMEIPNVLNFLVFLAGVSSIWLLPQISLKEHLIGMICVSLPLLVITLIIPGAFGGGDIKLMFGAGLLLGWKLALVALFFGIISGGIYAVCLLAKKKAGRKDHFAFGPFLCFGITLSMICGSQILNMYLEVGRRLYGKF